MFLPAGPRAGQGLPLYIGEFGFDHDSGTLSSGASVTSHTCRCRRSVRMVCGARAVMARAVYSRPRVSAG